MNNLLAADFRIILDTNAVIRGLANRESPSAQILRLCETRQVRLLLSKAILSEYRNVLSYPEIIARHPAIDDDSAESLFRRLRYVSEYFKLTRQKFRFDRDPRDEKFLELAIAANATHIISYDLDLLSLTYARTDAAKRFRQRLPKTQILKAADFIQIWIKRN